MLQDDHFMGYDGGEEYLCQEQTRNLFGQPDVLLVNEYLHVYQGNYSETPEVRLVAAVLQDGINSYIKCMSARTRRGRKLVSEAEEWFLSKDEGWLFSFENVCGILNLEPDHIRRALLRHKQEYAEWKKSKRSSGVNPSRLLLSLAS